MTIVGSSGGGQWSLWLALDAPQRVHALAPMGMPAVCLPGFRPRANMRLASAPGLGPLLFALPSSSRARTVTHWIAGPSASDRAQPRRDARSSSRPGFTGAAIKRDAAAAA